MALSSMESTPNTHLDRFAGGRLQRVGPAGPPKGRQRLPAKFSDDGGPYEQRCCSHAFARARFGTFGMTSPLCLLIVLSSTQISACA